MRSDKRYVVKYLNIFKVKIKIINILRGSKTIKNLNTNLKFDTKYQYKHKDALSVWNEINFPLKSAKNFTQSHLFKSNLFVGKLTSFLLLQ